jgi:hypothetical protein
MGMTHIHKPSGNQCQLSNNTQRRLIMLSMRAHLCADSHEEASHAKACAKANCCDFAADVLHGVVDCQRWHHLVSVKLSIRF